MKTGEVEMPWAICKSLDRAFNAPISTRGVASTRITLQTARSNIHAGISRQRSDGEPVRLQRKTIEPARSTA